MPLSDDARKNINDNFKNFTNGSRMIWSDIGNLTEEQLYFLNSIRKFNGKSDINNPCIKFMGRHLFESRHNEDKYSIEEIYKMIKNSISEKAFPAIDHRYYRTSLSEKDKLNPNFVSPDIKYYDGNPIQHVSVFKFNESYNYLELYNVIPYGDGKNHTKTEK